MTRQTIFSFLFATNRDGRRCRVSPDRFNRGLLPTVYCVLLISLFLAVLTSFVERAEARDSAYSQMEAELELKGDGTKGPYALGDFIVVKGSQSVWVDSLLKRPIEYDIDYLGGLLTFKESISSTSEIKVKFLKLPSGLKRVHRHRKALPFKEEELTPEKDYAEPQRNEYSSPALDEHRDDDFSDLEVGGSKTFGISVGSNRDLSLEQALRVNISGKIGDDLEVVAILSDQSTPIHPDGSTRALKELDKVLIEVRSKVLSATLGDIDLSSNHTEFGNYSRKLQGIKGQISLAEGEATIFSATSAGNFLTKEIHPIDGSQGPYRLTSEDGKKDIVVHPGTEKVWLDGRLLTRGGDYDYTIDYSRGEITFTHRRPITADSRLVVDYEYADGTFQRNSVGGWGKKEFVDGKLKIGVSFIREADSPVDRRLNLPGARRYGLPDGSEALGQAPIEPPIKSGVGGKPAGSLDGAFSFVGSQKGDYRYTGSDYEYVGPGRGSYSLSSPESSSTLSGGADMLPTAVIHQLSALNLFFSPDSRFNISGEIALSNVDQNIFSNKDGGTPAANGDKFGRAYRFHLSTSPYEIRAFGSSVGSVQFSALHRALGDNFSPAGRIREVEENRRWGLSLSQAVEGETLQEFKAAHLLTSRSRLSIGYGRIRRESGFSGQRRELSLTISENNLPELGYFLEVIDRSGPNAFVPGKITRQSAEAGAQIWRLRPELSFENERARMNVREFGEGYPGSKSGYDQIEGELSSIGWGQLDWSSSFGMRKTHNSVPLSFDSDSSRAYTGSHRIKLNNWRSLNLSAKYSHRKRVELGPSGDETKSDLARIKANFSPARRSFFGDLDYEVSSTQTATKTRNFIYVGRGRGSYVWEDRDHDRIQDEEEFIPDADGDYGLYIERTGDFQPVREISANLAFRFDPKRLLKDTSSSLLVRIVRAISIDTFARGERKTLRESKAGYFDLYRFHLGDSVIKGGRSLRGNLYLFRYGRPLSARLRYESRDDLDREFSTGEMKRSTLLKSFRIRSKFARRSDAEIEYTDRADKRAGKSAFSFDILSRKVELKCTYRPKDHIQTILNVTAGKDQNRVSGTPVAANYISIKPELSRSIKTKGKARAQLGWTKVSSNPHGASLPLQMAEGKTQGKNIDWNLGFDYKVGRYLTMIVSYRGENIPARDVRHTMRAEMQAFF